MNSPPNNKLRVSHEEIIIQWKKYQDSEINRLEYVKKLGLKNQPIYAFGASLKLTESPKNVKENYKILLVIKNNKPLRLEFCTILHNSVKDFFPPLTTSCVILLLTWKLIIFHIPYSIDCIINSNNKSLCAINTKRFDFKTTVPMPKRKNDLCFMYIYNKDGIVIETLKKIYSDKLARMAHLLRLTKYARHKLKFVSYDKCSEKPTSHKGFQYEDQFINILLRIVVVNTL
ncbi:hypothetical protein AGLY_010488 [Aphis glycines]|uniref:Uncharacterized protein n=1 Tax=Aphis glycines TaxID=307491 RepID=A0A6G0TDP7_APHGL|nr:hypothetical protein AGLY_010488 [Aphis glycines]